MSMTFQGAAWSAIFLTSLMLAMSCGSGSETPPAEEKAAEKTPASALGDALLFNAGFDDGWDAAYAAGDRRIYFAESYKEQDKATPGISTPDAEIVDGGRVGRALRFNKKNTKAIFYRAENNTSYSATNWTGTLSFWLSLDPATDLEPGFCDPIQVTDSAYNDACIWVDFSDKNPRQFRMGVFGDLTAWNPQDIPPDKNENFTKRLVPVQEPPFAKGKWTHILISHEGLGSGQGSAKLYLDGVLQGEATGIAEPFTWDASQSSIRLGVNYVGLMDEIAIFNRALTQDEIQALHNLTESAASLRQ